MAARLTAFVVVGIVAATVIAGLIVGAQRDDAEGPVDLIVHNAVVYTADDDGTMAEAVAVRGNQVLRVGSEREILRLRRPQTTVIDARGGAVLPGFNDAHTHLIGGGLSLDRIDLAGAASVEEIQVRIRAWAESNPDAQWVLGRGWRYEAFPDALPTRQMLDEVVADRPVQITCYDGHAVWVNSHALRLAGIDRHTPDPTDGAIVRDARTGEPMGVLRESAMALVARVVPEPTREERARALRAAIAEAHRNGITSVQNAGGTTADFELYSDARRTGDLNLRIHSSIPVEHAIGDADLARIEALGRLYPDDPLFKPGAAEIRLDGVIGGHSAAMLEPYSSDPSRGAPRMAPDDLNRTVRLLDRIGWQVMTHASGDRAVRLALDAYEHAVRSNPLPRRGRRHRIEHAETVDPDDVPRFGLLDVVASMQPYHGSPSPAQIDLWSRRLGTERLPRLWAYGSITRVRGRLAFGSDWPVVSMSPMLGIHTAVTRTTITGVPEGGWYPDQRITLKAALDAYTSGAAWASFDEQRKGTIATGMLADLVILGDNIFEAPPSALARTPVSATIFDGKVVYRRGDSSTN